jgi:glycyl-tRNA synthetase beta chain
VIVSNLDSKNANTVITGNMRVINARLSDATFFYAQDKKQSLENRLAKLKLMTFQEKLGSMLDRVKRIEKYITFLGKALHQSSNVIKETKRAAKLSKSDLTSSLVYEFPELQGIAGYYYALHDQESKNCALAIREHYKPCFSGDTLPSTIQGQMVALADKIDTLVSIIGLNQVPSGDKDPFALRRAALGVIRICIEKKLSFDLERALKSSCQQFHSTLPNKKVILQTLEFIMQRLKSWYLDQGTLAQQFMSVAAINVTNLVDFDARLKAVFAFVQMPDAESLSTANKRVMNILKKQKINQNNHGSVNTTLFEHDAEKKLYQAIKRKQRLVETLSKNYQYEQALNELTELKTPIDAFFDHVFVMVNNKRIQKNRLELLVQLRQLLTSVADIAYLSV